MIQGLGRLDRYDVLVLDDANIDESQRRQTGGHPHLGRGRRRLHRNGPYAYVPGLLAVTVNGGPQWSAGDAASHTSALSLTDYSPAAWDRRASSSGSTLPSRRRGSRTSAQG